jgi:hypothetical protein
LRNDKRKFLWRATTIETCIFYIQAEAKSETKTTKSPYPNRRELDKESLALVNRIYCTPIILSNFTTTK